MTTLLAIVVLFLCGYFAGMIQGYNKAMDEFQNIIKRLERRK